MPEDPDVTSTLITEPCFWTPALPFLYLLEVHVTWKDGTKSFRKQFIGLRRWEVLGRSLFQERRRIVFRGLSVETLTSELLATAAERECSIVTGNTSDELLAEASELGVSVFIDLRGAEEHASSELARFSWYPAVAGVLLSGVPTGHQRLPNGAKLGVVVGSDDEEQQYVWADMVVVELQQDELPPAWLAKYEKPVLAVRREDLSADFTQVRARCDQLQASLAPDFDLAGYLV